MRHHINAEAVRFFADPGAEGNALGQFERHLAGLVEAETETRQARHEAETIKHLTAEREALLDAIEDVHGALKNLANAVPHDPTMFSRDHIDKLLRLVSQSIGRAMLGLGPAYALAELRAVDEAIDESRENGEPVAPALEAMRRAYQTRADKLFAGSGPAP